MSDVTRILSQIESGDPAAAEQLFSLVYDELRQLAAQYIAREKPGQTLQATALVNEAFLRIVGQDGAAEFANRRHFFGAASEAMRRILVEQFRRKRAQKRGGALVRVEFVDAPTAAPDPDWDFEALSNSLDRLGQRDSEAAELVKLRFFTGLTNSEVATILGMSERSAERLWAYARSFLHHELHD